MPYIESNLHAKTILLTGASKLTDLSAVAEDKDSELEKLVEAAHKTKGIIRGIIFLTVKWQDCEYSAAGKLPTNFGQYFLEELNVG